ncbi:MAG: 3'-5' exoribonuclease, partial [Chitinivibrionales bacterium]|nr:3'-5' exoribonuclease [Chitinivibrionales bacterium]
MPRLFDLLSDRTDKDALLKIQKKAHEKKKTKNEDSQQPTPVEKKSGQNHEYGRHPQQNQNKNQGQSPNHSYQKKQHQFQQQNQHHQPQNPHVQNRSQNQQRPETASHASGATGAHHTAGVRIPEFVALDVETTGLDTKHDRIIEIGAVRFKAGKPVQEFSTLIKPPKPIPPQVQELTGITNEAVQSARPFCDVADELIAFIAQSPLCGHQIHFDISFVNNELKRIGKDDLRVPLLDSAILSRLLLLDASGYSLGQVCKHLRIDLKNAHRALDDARACGIVAATLVPSLLQLKVHVRQMLASIAPHSLMKIMLIRSIPSQQKAGLKPAFDAPAQTCGPSIESLPCTDPYRTVDREELEALLRRFDLTKGTSDGSGTTSNSHSTREILAGLAASFNAPGFFLAQVTESFCRQKYYTLLASLWAQRNSCRVVIAVNSKDLMEQIADNCMPLAQTFSTTAIPWSILRSRSSYLCNQRWKRFLGSTLGTFSPQERLGALSLVRWAAETTTGDIEQQRQFNTHWFGRVWSLVNAEASHCRKEKCLDYASCFYFNALARCKASSVVLVNHGVVFTDLCTNVEPLGQLGAMVFDEAHLLLHNWYRFMRTEFDTNRLHRLIELLTLVLQELEHISTTAKQTQAMNGFKALCKTVRKQSDDLLNECITLLRQQPTPQENTGNGNRRFSVVAVSYDDSTFQKSRNGSTFLLVIEQLCDSLKSLIDEFGVCDQSELFENLMDDLETALSRAAQIKADCRYLFSAQTPDHFFWLEGDPQKQWIKICGVALAIEEYFNDLWQRKKSTPLILTTQALTLKSEPSPFQMALGIDSSSWSIAQYKSANQNHRCIAYPILDRSSGNVSAQIPLLLPILKKCVLNTDRRCLILFSDSAMAAAAYSQLHTDADIGQFCTKEVHQTSASAVSGSTSSSESTTVTAPSDIEDGKQLDMQKTASLPLFFGSIGAFEHNDRSFIAEYDTVI